jgi:hypothetical protein
MDGRLRAERIALKPVWQDVSKYSKSDQRLRSNAIRNF